MPLIDAAVLVAHHDAGAAVVDADRVPSDNAIAPQQAEVKVAESQV